MEGFKGMKNKISSMSAQELFMYQHRIQHRHIRFWRCFILIAFLLFWELGTNFNLIDSFFFSSPSRIVRCFFEMLQVNHLTKHILITVAETLVSFIFVNLISLFLAVSLWYSKNISQITEPYIVILNSLPKSALAPLFIVWFGTGMKTIIIAGISVAVFGSIISFYTAFQQIDSSLITLVYTLGGNKSQAFRKVVLPASLTTLLSTAKVNIGLSLVGVIIGEFLAARTGLGYLIIYGSQVFQMDMLITSILILCFISYMLYKAIQFAEHKIKKAQKQ